MKFDFGDDMENAMRDRNSRMHPAEFEYGMSDNDFGGGNDPFGGGSSDFGNDPFGGGSSGFGNDPFGGGGSSGFGNDPFGGGSSGFGNDPYSGGVGYGGGQGELPGYQNYGGAGYNQQPTKDMDEQVFDAAVKGLKESWEFLKECIAAFKETTPETFMSVGKESLLLGIALSIVGLILGLFKITVGWHMLIGASIAAVLGIVIFFINMSTAKKRGALQGANNEPALNDGFDTFAEAPSAGFADEDDEFTIVDDEESQNNGGFGNDGFGNDDDFGNSSFGNNGFGSDFDFEEEEPQNMTEVLDADNPLAKEVDDFRKQINTDAIIDSINVTNGVVTRQYLFEHFMPLLGNKTPRFMDTEALGEDTSEFAQWVTVVKYATEALMPNEDAPEPQLISVKKKLFYTLLTVERVSWLKSNEKLKSFKDEIINTVSYDTETDTKSEDVYAEVTAVGKEVYIKIMTGVRAFITVKDIYDKQKEFMLNTQNYMPVALGLDITGNPVMHDLKKVNSMLVAGEPRSGKSWFVKTILAQLLMFNSPDELQFYFCDPKDGVSDFVDIRTPHVKRFAATDDSIIETIRELAHGEGNRRQKLFSEIGVKTIWDYKKAKPNDSMPLIYVVIDEVTTLTSRMSQDDRKSFEKLLLEYISRLPAYGIRLWVIPHLVKNQILSKSVTDLIPWRACVRFKQSDVCNLLGVKSFPHKLSVEGDMALRTPDQTVSYVHGAVMATSDAEYRQIFEQISAVWQKVNSEYTVDIEEIHNEGLMDSDDIGGAPERQTQAKKTKSQKSAAKTTAKTSTKAKDTANKQTYNENNLISFEDEDDDEEIPIW